MKVKQLISRKRRQAAFSLVEVTVAMGVIGTTAGAMLTGIAGGFFTMQLARENVRATQILLEKVETIRLYDWDQINTPGFIPTNFVSAYDPNSSNQGLNYRGTLTIGDATSVTSSYASEMKQVTVRLDWKTGNLDRTRTFTTFISRDGLQNYIY
jgi:type II secretory pathway pseudopilin PulG